MNNNDAHEFANLLLADLHPILPDLTDEQAKKIQAMIVGWLQRLTVVLK